MIVVNGRQYRTLGQKLYANGKRVRAAYCNGTIVYPEREDTQLVKVVGHIDQIISHGHAGEDPSAETNSGYKYIYEGRSDYWAKGSFSLVLRSHDAKTWHGDDAKLTFQNYWTTYPAAEWPLNTVAKQQMVFTYDWSTAPMVPTGDGVHPLLGAPELRTHRIFTGDYMRARISAELLLHVFVSAPAVCPWTSPKVHFGLGLPYTDVSATPKDPQLAELPSDVNGVHWMHSYYKDKYYGLSWGVSNGATGRSFTVELLYPGRHDTSRGKYCNYLTLSSSYEVPYVIRGTRGGAVQQFEKSYNQEFNIINIPITDLVYSGDELTAPQEHLHPSLDDISEYM